jgi:hypothetical protein
VYERAVCRTTMVEVNYSFAPDCAPCQHFCFMELPENTMGKHYSAMRELQTGTIRYTIGVQKYRLKPCFSIVRHQMCHYAVCYLISTLRSVGFVIVSACIQPVGNTQDLYTFYVVIDIVSSPLWGGAARYLRCTQDC